jgi:hypothetical protein
MGDVTRLSDRSQDSGETGCQHGPDRDERYCHGRKRQGTGICHRPAGEGTPHRGIGRCKRHGGCLPNIVKHDTMELARRRATKELVQLNADATPVDNPLAALASLAGEAVRWKDILAAHVSELSSLRFTVRPTVKCPECETSFTPEHAVGTTEQVRGEVLLYERSLTDLGRLLVAIGRLNLDDRLARIDDRLADIIVRSVDAGLTAAGVRTDDMDRVRAVVGAQIRRLSA